MTFCVINLHFCDYRVYCSVCKWDGMIEKVENKKQRCILWYWLGMSNQRNGAAQLKRVGAGSICNMDTGVS